MALLFQTEATTSSSSSIIIPSFATIDTVGIGHTAAHFLLQRRGYPFPVATYLCCCVLSLSLLLLLLYGLQVVQLSPPPSPNPRPLSLVDRSAPFFFLFETIHLLFYLIVLFSFIVFIPYWLPVPSLPSCSLLALSFCVRLSSYTPLQRFVPSPRPFEMTISV